MMSQYGHTVDRLHHLHNHLVTAFKQRSSSVRRARVLTLANDHFEGHDEPILNSELQNQNENNEERKEEEIKSHCEETAQKKV